MSQPTETFDSYDAKGNRESLIDTIYNISPIDTPFISMVADISTARAVKHEWQTDALAAVNAGNAQLEGDDASGSAITATSRLDNVCQISSKTVIVSGTQEAVEKSGRTLESAYQVAKAGNELKRDMEAVIVRNQASVAGNASTARKLRSLESWFTTNTSRASGGANGSTTQAATDATTGALRDFTEVLLKDMVEKVWSSGGRPDILMVGSKNKQKVSAFTGNSTRMDLGEDKRLVAAIDIYESDFGAIKVVPNRFQRDRSAFLLQKDMWGVAYLRPFVEKSLADTGDHVRSMVIAEYTLEARNEASSGVVADLTA
jgi:hypothetical protein